ELSTFAASFDMSGRRRDSNDEGLPPYDHLNLHACFGAARRVINQLLAEVSVGPEFRVTLEPHEDYLVASIPREFFAARNRFYLVTQTASKHEYSSESFLQSARLAAPQSLPVMIDHALPGIDLIEVATPPQGRPKRAHAPSHRIHH